MEDKGQGFEKGKVFSFPEMIEYTAHGIVSKQVVKTQGGNVTLFSFDAGEGLSEHTAPFDALVQVIEGSAEIVIGGEKFLLSQGDSIIMPSSVPHSIFAPEKFKMILTMVR